MTRANVKAWWLCHFAVCKFCGHRVHRLAFRTYVDLRGDEPHCPGLVRLVFPSIAIHYKFAPSGETAATLQDRFPHQIT